MEPNYALVDLRPGMEISPVLPIDSIKKQTMGLFKSYILTESVKSYEMLTRRTTQNKFNNKHRSTGKVHCNVFQGTYTFWTLHTGKYYMEETSLYEPLAEDFSTLMNVVYKEMFNITQFHWTVLLK